MKETISATEIDECTEISKVLNNTGTNIADLKLAEELVVLLLLRSCHKLLTITDDSALHRIELSDHKLDILTLILGEISLEGIRYEGCRDKYTCTIYLDIQAALNNLNNLTGKNGLVLECILELLGCLGSECLSVRKNNLSLSVVNLLYLTLDFIADIDYCGEVYSVICAVITSGHDTIGLVPNVECNLVWLYTNNLTSNNLPCMNRL